MCELGGLIQDDIQLCCDVTSCILSMFMRFIEIFIVWVTSGLCNGCSLDTLNIKKLMLITSLNHGKSRLC